MSASEYPFNGRPQSHWLDLRLHGTDEERWEAIDAIRHDCAPEISVPIFIETLQKDSYWRARALAAHAIYDLACEKEFHASLKNALLPLTRSLQDPNVEVRKQALAALELLRPQNSTN